jgi:hypothetical protein
MLVWKVRIEHQQHAVARTAPAISREERLLGRDPEAVVEERLEVSPE